MLTRKQQWRRTKVRRARGFAAAAAAAAATGTHKKTTAAVVDHLEGHERADSDQTTLSTWSSFDSLRDDDDGDSCSAVPLACPPPAAERSVSFQQEVQVFLVTHKSELDTSVKQALWWTGRDAAINKRAWLNHLGQPGCGRQSAGRPRPKHQHHHHQHHQQQQQQLHHQQDRSSNFLGAGRNTAAGRGRGSGALFAHNNNNNGGEFDGEQGGPADASEPLPVEGVGILGCRCDACLTEGDEHELDHEQQERLQWRQEQQLLPPRYAQAPPPPYNDQPPPRYNEAYSRPTGMPQQQTAAAGRGVRQQRRAGRGASKSWPSSEDWDTNDDDDLGGKGSRSYSPGSASGSSPLHEACEAYDDDEASYFFDS